jgi:ferredoxin/flavodoxin---NADP+ reductase
VIKDPETYDRFEKIVLLHGCRRVAELAYGEMITEKLPQDELIGESIREQLIYYPTVTRDPFRNRGRITNLITSGKLFSDISLPNLDAAKDRVMICGSPALLSDTKSMLLERGFEEGNHGKPRILSSRRLSRSDDRRMGSRRLRSARSQLSGVWFANDAMTNSPDSRT